MINDKKTWEDYLIGAILIIWSLIILIPFYNILLLSLTDHITAIKTPVLFYPKNVTLSSYQVIADNPYILDSMFVTVMLMAFGIPYSLFVSTTFAYSLSKKLPLMKFLTLAMVFTLYFGGGLIPFYLTIKSLGLVNSLFAMIFPHGATVFYVVILRNFFQNVPKDLEESAYLDGANDVGIFFKIILPITTPILVTIGLFIAVTYWNEWWHCLLFISDPKKQSLQFILRSILIDVSHLLENLPGDMDTTDVFDEGMKAAVIFVTTLPIAAVYPFLQKYFVSGLTKGALKF